jgi:thiamine pyrophosphokinase
MKTLIVTGGTPPSRELYDRVITQFRPEHIIGVDSGLSFFHAHGLVPDYAVGDFDSVRPELVCYFETQCSIVRLNAHKDETDTEVAIQTAASALHSDGVILLGALGGRLDHTLGNLYLMDTAFNLGMKPILIDEEQMIFLIDDVLSLNGIKGATVSLLAHGGAARGITLAGFEYPLINETLGPSAVRGISNVATDDTATIHLSDGKLFVFINR